MRSIILATKNPHKLRELREILQGLDVEVVGLERLRDVPEPHEHGETFAENARLKALYYAKATGTWCLADDSGLEVDALGGRPGVHSARFAADRLAHDADRATIDAANNSKLLSLLEDVSDEDRSARFVCHLALAGPEGIVLEADGKVEGRIARAPAGQNGFGYDPLFYLPESGCTSAELSPERKNRISHRGRAVRRFAELLKDILKENSSS